MTQLSLSLGVVVSLAAGCTALFRAKVDKRRVEAETGKLKAEEANVWASAAAVLVEPLQAQYTSTWARLTLLEKESAAKISSLEKKARRSEQEAVQLRKRLVELEAKMSQLRSEQAQERSKYQSQIEGLRSEIVKKEEVITSLRLQLGTT